MLACILFAVVVFLCKRASFPNALGIANVHQASMGDDSLSSYPSRFRENQNELSFAGRTQMNVRNPFGPNPQQKYVQEMKFFDDDTVQHNYAENLRQMHIQNQDWRLDPTTNSHLNNFAQRSHQPEDNLRRILEYSNS